MATDTSDISPGTLVTVKGLSTKTEYNNCLGIVLETSERNSGKSQSGRVAIQLRVIDNEGGPRMVKCRVPRENVHSLRRRGTVLQDVGSGLIHQNFDVSRRDYVVFVCKSTGEKFFHKIKHSTRLSKRKELDQIQNLLEGNASLLTVSQDGLYIYYSELWDWKTNKERALDHNPGFSMLSSLPNECISQKFAFSGVPKGHFLIDRMRHIPCEKSHCEINFDWDDVSKDKKPHIPTRECTGLDSADVEIISELFNTKPPKEMLERKQAWT